MRVALLGRSIDLGNFLEKACELDCPEPRERGLIDCTHAIVCASGI